MNNAPIYRGLEGAREYVTTGKGGYLHPFQGAAQAEQKIVARVAASFAELIVFRFVATNMQPPSFAWLNGAQTVKEYGAALVRIAFLYENRF